MGTTGHSTGVHLQLDTRKADSTPGDNNYSSTPIYPMEFFNIDISYITYSEGVLYGALEGDFENGILLAAAAEKSALEESVNEESIQQINDKSIESKMTTE